MAATTNGCPAVKEGLRPDPLGDPGPHCSYFFAEISLICLTSNHLSPDFCKGCRQHTVDEPPTAAAWALASRTAGTRSLPRWPKCAEKMRKLSLPWC